MKIQEWVTAAYENSKAHGWYEGVEPGDRSLIPEKLCLIHSEISEALEAVRDRDMGHVSPSGKPEGFSAEMADVVIRVFDLCGHLSIDAEATFGQTEKDFSSLMLLAAASIKEKKNNRSVRISLPAELCGLHDNVSCAYNQNQYADEHEYADDMYSFNHFLIQVVWHCMTLCSLYDIDLEAAVTLKHEYNKGRPHRHGGKSC
jgi:NTP pyrophosphatase (non-canonical NTP hydrolase)